MALPEGTTTADTDVSQSAAQMTSSITTLDEAEEAQVVMQDEPETMSASPTSASPLTTQETNPRNEVKAPRRGTRDPHSPYSAPPSAYRGPRRSERQQSSMTDASSSQASSSTPASPLSSRDQSGSNNVNARTRSQRKSSFEYKETLDATMRHLEDGSRIINQYKLGKMIGQGAYGSVYDACLLDDPSQKFAIKEFGKTRLRKRNRAQNLRKPSAARGRGRGSDGGGGEHQSSLPRRVGEATIGETGVQAVSTGLKMLNVIGEGADRPQSPPPSPKDPISLIRREIAILKKLHHPHLVRLYEVLDDPSKDGLFMVFEHCPGGTVIDVRLHEQVEPIDEPIARNYLIQIMLGIEYLHYHDIVHRDIKPDNILLKDGRKTCKIVDFGVSEFFVKPGDDRMHGSAGSPAFMSPELCTAGHGDLSAKESDMWSLGVTFYCMVVGRLPFDKHQFLELYESIKADEPDYPSHLSQDCKDLLKRLLAKRGSERITISQMREHPFITKRGVEHIMSREENIKDVVDGVTAEEVASAIINIASVFTLARAISKFKRAGSRASSAGSLNELTSTLISKRNEVLEGDTTTTAANDGKGKDDAPGEKDSETSGSDEQPSLLHVAEAHIVASSSNRERAAEHLARGVMKVTDKMHQKWSRHRPHLHHHKDQSSSGEEGKADSENDGSSSQAHGDATPQRLHSSTERGPEVYSRDEAGRKVDASPKSDSQVDQGENGETSERMLNTPQPKLFPQQPTVVSPHPADLATPDGAADSYIGKR